MTISEYLVSLKRVMLFQGANEMEALYFQLYLLSLGYDGLLLADAEHRKGAEPYATLDKHFSHLWDKAIENYEKEGKGILEEFLEDKNIILNPDKAFFLVEFNEVLAREARHGGYRFDHTQPEELSNLVYRLSGFKTGMIVYNPYAGFGSYASAFQIGDDYFGEEIDLLTWGIGVLKMHMDGSSSANYVQGNSFCPTWNRRFDIVVSSPPLGIIPPMAGSSTRRIDYSDRLLNDLPTLLKDEGSCIIVSSASILTRGARRLLDSSMLDMVTVLPDNLLFSTASVQVIIRLKKDRDSNAPVLMVDAKDFFSPGGRQKSLDVERVIHAINVNDSEHVAWVSPEVIRKNDCLLFPHVYLADENHIEGLSYVPIKELGTVLRPQSATLEEDSLIPFVSVNDLSQLPTHIVSPAISESRNHAYARVLTSPALLMARSSDSLRLGYIQDCSLEHPVYVSQMIMAFIPNEDIVSWEYVAAALSEVTLSNMGSSAFRLNFTDFAITKIPVISKREQALYVKRILRKSSRHREKAIESTREIPVILIGLTEIKDKTGRLKTLRHFERMNDAKDWLNSHPTAAEAIIAQIGTRVTESNVSTLCDRGDNIPVFILSSDLDKLETVFQDNSVEYELGERAFSPDMVDDLLETLAEVADLARSPEGEIRRRYKDQLEDAESLDNFFQYKNLLLSYELEDILLKLSKHETGNMPTRMRLIRDNCLLQPLIDYGYLPSDLVYGALTDLLTDRIYQNGDDKDSRIVLNTEILPESIAKLLQTASKTVFNPGSHIHLTEDDNTLMACLCVLMAALGILADMVDRGKFKEKDSPKGYFSNVSPTRFNSGMYEVRRLEEIKGFNYFYAGNIHLDNRICQRNGIKAGDIVQIDRIDGFEKEPKIDDFVQVYFYAKEFKKVE